MATIRGIWKFRTPIDEISSQKIELSYRILGVNLQDYGYENETFTSLQTTSSGNLTYEYIGEGGNETYFTAFDVNTGEWQYFNSAISQTIYVGDDGQELNDDDYTWFVNNATQITYGIEGTWQLLDFFKTFDTTPFLANVNFVVFINGETYNGIKWNYNEETGNWELYFYQDEAEYLISETNEFTGETVWYEEFKDIEITSVLSDIKNGEILLNWLLNNATGGTPPEEEPDKPIDPTPPTPDEPDEPIEPDDPDEPIIPPILNTPTNVIAGIGDREQSVNLIMPQFDATIYNFIVGASGIIDGFKVTQSGNNVLLSAGTLLVKGFRGITTEAHLFQKGYKVYARFVFNNDINTTDEFLIFDTSSDIIVYETDISEVTPEIAGTYDILLINTLGELNLEIQRLTYPINAKNSDYADEVTTALLEGVTGVTAPINSNNNLVATTEYVHNQIQEEINYKTLNNTQTITVSTGSGILERKAIIETSIEGIRKAKICNIKRINITITSEGSDAVQVPANTVLFNFPNEFIPNIFIDLNLGYSNDSLNSTYENSGFYINTNGQLCNETAFFPTTTSMGYISHIILKNIGYETN